MKAARLLGPKRPVVISDVEDPHPGPNEVVVKIKASGVCHSDLHIAEADFAGVSYPLTLGHEPAGYIHEIGSGILGFEEGTPVLVYITRGCGACGFCRRGEENNCDQGESMGFDRDGSHAEFLLVDSTRYLYPIQGLEPEEAASLACAGLTAYHAVKAEALPLLQPDDFAIIIGVGGLGHIALQLLKKLGLSRVIAVDKNEEKLGFAKRCGADYTVVARDNMLSEIRKIAAHGVAVALDFVGSTFSLKAGYEALSSKGRLVIVGAAGGSLEVNSEPTRGRETHGSILGSLGEMRELIELAKLGAFKVSHQTFPIEQINVALKLLKEGRIEGRAVLTM